MRGVFLLACVAMLPACSDVGATNPFDPSTPAAQQAKASLTGTLLLPAGYGVEHFAEIQVELAPGEGEARASEVGVDGAFSFEDVPADAYALRLRSEAFLIAPRTIVVDLAAQLDLGIVEVAEGGLGVVTGIARRAGAGELGHQGIAVELLGSPAVHVTGPDGAFRLEAPAGRYDLRASAPGYGSETLTRVEVRRRQVEVIEAPLTLESEPGSVQGVVRLAEGFEDEALLRAAVVQLLTSSEEDTPRVSNPQADGRFTFPEVPAGPYVL